MGLSVLEAIDNALLTEKPSAPIVEGDERSYVVEAIDRHFWILDRISGLPLTESDDLKKRNVNLYHYFYLKSFLEADQLAGQQYEHRPSSDPNAAEYRNGYKAGWKHSHQGGQVDPQHIQQLAASGHSQEYLQGYQHGHEVRSKMAAAVNRGDAANQAAEQHKTAVTAARNQAADLAKRGFKPEHPEMQAVIKQHDAALGGLDAAAKERAAAHDQLVRDVVGPHIMAINGVHVKLPEGVNDNLDAWTQNYDAENAKGPQSPIHGPIKAILNKVDTAVNDPANANLPDHKHHPADVPMALGRSTKNLVRYGRQEKAVVGREDPEKFKAFGQAQGMGAKKHRGGAPSDVDDREAGDTDAERAEGGDAPGEAELGDEKTGSPEPDVKLRAADSGEHGNADDDDDAKPETSPTGVHGVDSDHLEYIMRHMGGEKGRKVERAADVARVLKLPPEKVVKAFRLEIARRQEKEEKAGQEADAAEKEKDRLAREAEAAKAAEAAQKGPGIKVLPLAARQKKHQAGAQPSDRQPGAPDAPAQPAAEKPSEPQQQAAAGASPPGEPPEQPKARRTRTIKPIAPKEEHPDHARVKAAAHDFIDKDPSFISYEDTKTGKKLDYKRLFHDMVNHPNGMSGPTSRAEAAKQQGIGATDPNELKLLAKGHTWSRHIANLVKKMHDRFGHEPAWQHHHMKAKKPGEAPEAGGEQAAQESKTFLAQYALWESLMRQGKNPVEATELAHKIIFETTHQNIEESMFDVLTSPSIFDGIVEDDVVDGAAGGDGSDDEGLEDQPEPITGDGDENYASSAPKKPAKLAPKQESMFDKFTTSIFDDIVSE